MYIVFALIVAAALGVAAHFLLPRRELRGAVLTPAIAVGTAAVLYAVCTWTLGEASGWTWLISLVAPIVAAVAATLVLSARRARHDDRRRAELRA